MIAVAEFKRLVAPDVLPCPDPIVQREVVSTLLEFCAKTGVLRRDFEVDLSSLSISPSTQNSIDVDLSSIAPSLRPVSVMGLMVDGVRFDPRSRNVQTSVSDFASTVDFGVKHFHLMSNAVLRVYNMKSTDRRLWLDLSFKPLRSATEVDDCLFEDYSEAIVAGAKWKILSMPGKDWTDLTAAQVYYMQYRRYLSQAVREVSKGKSGGPDRVSWKSFGELD